MIKRILLAAMACAGALAAAAELRAATVEVQLYPLTGEVRLANPNPVPFSFVYYELNSAASAFAGVPAAWTSISDTYDVSGNGFVDPVNNWTKFAGNAAEVAEGVFSGSGALPPSRSISLGLIWNAAVAGANDVTALVYDSTLQAADAAVVLALAGDYNRDLVVDALDYNVWQESLGAIDMPDADGNFDGVVDAADFTIWRDHYGQNLSGAGLAHLLSPGSGSLGSISTVPEPTGLTMLLATLGSLATWRRRQ